MIDLILRRTRLASKLVLRRDLDVLDELQMDHLRVDILFTQIKATKNKKRRQMLYQRIKKALNEHMIAEETVLYPKFENDEKLKPIVLESYEEHRQIKTLLRELGDLSPTTDKWEARLSLLIENIHHHVREEEGKFFPRIRRKYDREELLALAKEIKSAKRQSEAAA